MIETALEELLAAYLNDKKGSAPAAVDGANITARAWSDTTTRAEESRQLVVSIPAGAANFGMGMRGLFLLRSSAIDSDRALKATHDATVDWLRSLFTREQVGTMKTETAALGVSQGLGGRVDGFMLNPEDDAHGPVAAESGPDQWGSNIGFVVDGHEL